MIQIAIVDDEQKCIDTTTSFIKQYFEKEGSAYEITVFRDGLDLINNYSAKYDLIFLDIEMKLMDGMAAAKKIREQDEKVILIFITRMEQFAARGYDVDAIGFMVKPIDYFSFQLKMQKALNLIKQRQSVHLIVTDNYEKHVLNSSTILYIEVMGHNVSIHTTKGEYHDWSSLKDCAERLKKAHFSFVSRYQLVNLEHVKSIVGNAVQVGEEELPLSRSKKKEFMVALSEYYGGKV